MQLNILRSDSQSAPFHDGMHEEQARLITSCTKCSHRFDVNLLSSISNGEKWFRSLTEIDQRHISKAFDCEFEFVGPNKIPYSILNNGRNAYYINLVCPDCEATSLVVVDFYEMQPARYIAVLANKAELMK